MCVFCEIMHRYTSLIYDSNKKTLLGKNAVSWLSIFFGSLVTIFVVGIFVHSFLEVKSAGSSDADMNRIIVSKKRFLTSQYGTMNKNNISSEITPDRSVVGQDNSDQRSKYADIRSSGTMLRTKRNMLYGKEESALPQSFTNVSDKQALPENLAWKDRNNTVQAITSEKQSSVGNQTAQPTIFSPKSTKKINTTGILSSAIDKQTNIIVKHANGIVIRLKRQSANLDDANHTPHEGNDNPDFEKLTRTAKTKVNKELDDNQRSSGISQEKSNNEQDMPEPLEKKNSTNIDQVPSVPTDSSNKTIMFSTVNKRTNINVKNAKDVIILKGQNNPGYTNRTPFETKENINRKKVAMKKNLEDILENDQSSFVSSQNGQRPFDEQFLINKENCKTSEEVQHTVPTENANNTKTVTSVVNKCTSINVNNAKDIIINMKRLVYSDDKPSTQNNGIKKQTKRDSTQRKKTAVGQISSLIFEDYEYPSTQENKEDASPISYYSENTDDAVTESTEITYMTEFTTKGTTTNDTTDSQYSYVESEDEGNSVTTERNGNDDTTTDIYYSEYNDYAITEPNAATNIKEIAKRENREKSEESAVSQISSIKFEDKERFVTTVKEEINTLKPTSQIYLENPDVTITNKTVTAENGENNNTFQFSYPDYMDPALDEYGNVVKENISKRAYREEEYKKILLSLRMPIFFLSQSINRPFVIIQQKNPATVRVRREDSDYTERTPIEATNSTDNNELTTKESGNQTYLLELEEPQKPESNENKNKKNITSKISNFFCNFANGTIEQFKKQRSNNTLTNISNKTETKDTATVIEVSDDGVATVEKPIAMVLNRYAALKLNKLENRNIMVPTASSLQKCQTCRCKDCPKQIASSLDVMSEDLNPMVQLNTSQLLTKIIFTDKDSELKKERLKRNCTIATPCDECFCRTSNIEENDTEETHTTSETAENGFFSDDVAEDKQRRFKRDVEKDIEETTFFNKLVAAKLMRLEKHAPIYATLSEVFDKTAQKNKDQGQNGR